MAEQTFKSPGFFESEIDLSQVESSVSGIPAGIAGTAHMGPAFVPVTVGSFIDFENRFGTLDPEKFGPYAVREFLKYKTAVTYVRVLGAGSNSRLSDFTTTEGAGIVKGAGFVLSGSAVAAGTDNGPTYDKGRRLGSIQFITARHYVSTSLESAGYPIFSDNDSTPLTDDTVNLVRGMILVPTGTRVQVLSWASSSYGGSLGIPALSNNNDIAKPSSQGLFKVVLSSSAGSNFAADDGFSGIKIFSCSLDPANSAYIGNVLNTSAEMFQKEQHMLYAHFPVENDVAEVDRGSTSRLWATVTGSICLASGSELGSSNCGLGSTVEFNQLYGRFDTRFTTPSTTFFISQPYGGIEYDLFKVESISDGAYANTKFKISIRDIRKSDSEGQDPYGTFTLEVREFTDSDTSPSVLERYTGCSLNPYDENYIARKVGDYKPFYRFDEVQESERKVVVSGKYPNMSKRIRVIPSTALDKGEIPDSALPFGFRGIEVLKTNDSLTDDSTALPGTDTVANNSRRLGACTGAGFKPSWGSAMSRMSNSITGSILPPIPLRFKLTKGNVEKSPSFTGEPGQLELVDARLYWGIKFNRLLRTGSVTTVDAIFRSNASDQPNEIVENYTKFAGIRKLDMLVTGSAADLFNNNKFTLARVCFYNGTGSHTDNVALSIAEQITGSAREHIREAAYIRNGVNDPNTYTIRDGSLYNNRLTMASLAAITSSVYFNKFIDYTKFTNILHGGFDGLNILDRNMTLMNDKASSADSGGYASTGILDIGLSTTANRFGSGEDNCTVQAYRSAARILTNEVTCRSNIVAIPGIRDAALTDYVAELLPGYGKAFYVMDIPSYDASGNRLFKDSENIANVEKTAQLFAGRSLDTNYSAAYFPDVRIEDPINNRPVGVPASVAVLGALSYNDSVSYPWFAPAGFNRGSLGFVTNTDVRLNQQDRDTLYENRINPIASFPNAGFVIFGQKTLQIIKSSLDRVNVRRMLLEVRRLVSNVAQNIVFDQNTPETRARFVSEVTPLLANVQSQQGIDQFRVVMDSSNNTSEDIMNNILNGRIVIVPTRAVEFIAIDFIITSTGVDFE